MGQTIHKMAGRNDPFARIPHTTLEDPAITWEAKGILCYLVGKPDGWKMRVADIANHGPAGETKIRAALKSLRAAGYAEFIRERNQSGAFNSGIWKVSDSSIFSPRCGFPHVDNRHSSKNNSISKKKTKTKKVKPHKSKFMDITGPDPVYPYKVAPTIEA